MELAAIVTASVRPEDDYVIVNFTKDKTGQKFKIFIDQPFRRLCLLDEILIKVKWRSVEINSEERIYLTELYAEEWTKIAAVPSKVRFGGKSR